MIQIVMTEDTVSPLLVRLGDTVRRSRPLMAALGKTLEKELRQHFAGREAEGNRHGWWRSHFWSKQVRTRTSLTAVSDHQATVTIASEEFAFKLYGGVITPKRGRARVLRQAGPLLPLKSQIPNPKSQIPNLKSQISSLKSQIPPPPAPPATEPTPCSTPLAAPWRARRSSP